MKLLHLIAACALAAAGILLDTPNLSADELSVGAATVDITPPLELKSPLGGYGMRMNKPATGVHDRIFAKALVFTNGTKKFALVTADLLGLAPPVKQAVIDRLANTGWTAGNVIILPSHSHTSIEMHAINPDNTFNIPQMGIHNPELFKVTMDRLAEVIPKAEKNPVPAKIGTDSVDLKGWNRNRRIPNGIVDPQLTLTRIDKLDGSPLAVFVNWTAHPTFMNEEDMLFSGDYPGHLQRQLELLIGRGVVAMYCNGAEGDQSTISRADSGGSRWERAERYGRELGLIAWQLWQKTPVERDVAFAFHREEISLPPVKHHPNYMETGGKEYGFTEELLKVMLPKLCPRSSASVSLRVGDLLVIGIPGEMACGLGLNIKQKAAEISGAKHPIIGGLADEWLSYIIPLEQYKMGQYEASVSFYGPTLADVITEGALRGVKNGHTKK